METATITRTKTFAWQHQRKQTIRNFNLAYYPEEEVRGVSWQTVKQRLKDKFVDYYGVNYDEI